MDIIKLEKFIFQSKKFQFGQQSQGVDSENRRLKYKVEILKYPKNVCEFIIALYSFSISKEEIAQIISVVLSKLAKKDIERFRSAIIRASLINARSPI